MGYADYALIVADELSFANLSNGKYNDLFRCAAEHAETTQEAIVVALATPLFDSPYFHTFVRKIEDEFEKNGYIGLTFIQAADETMVGILTAFFTKLGRPMTLLYQRCDEKKIQDVIQSLDFEKMPQTVRYQAA